MALRNFGNGVEAASNVQFPPADNKAVCLLTNDTGADLTIKKIWGKWTSGGGSAKVKGVVYSDNAGSPDALLVTSDERIGVNSGAWRDLTFSSAYVVAAGVSVWVGVISDTTITSNVCTVLTGGIKYNSDTYSDGASSTFGSPTTADFLYPIIVEGEDGTQTFGRRSIDQVGGNYQPDREHAEAFIVGANGESVIVSSISTYVQTTDASVKSKAAIYTDVSGLPDTKVAQTNEVTGSTASTWLNLPFATPVTLAPGTYWLAFIADTNLVTPVCNYSNTLRVDGDTTEAAAWPSTYPTTGAVFTVFGIDIYATYTTAAASTLQGQSVSGVAAVADAGDVTVTTSQGQTASAAASAGVAAATSTSQGQTASAAASAGVVGVTSTEQGQTAGAAASAGVAAVTSTEQGQSVAAIGSTINLAASMSQGQTVDAVASAGIAGAGATEQGQTASAAASTGVAGAAATEQGQSVAAIGGTINLVASVSQGQTAGAVAGIMINAVASASQGQTAVSATDTAVVAQSATSQAQRQAGEFLIAMPAAVAIGQGQSTSASCAVSTVGVWSTAQGQAVEAVAAPGAVVVVSVSQGQAAASVVGTGAGMAVSVSQGQTTVAAIAPVGVLSATSSQGQGCTAAVVSAYQGSVASQQGQTCGATIILGPTPAITPKKWSVFIVPDPRNGLSNELVVKSRHMFHGT